MIELILKELKEKYGFDRICETYASAADAMKDYYTKRVPGYYPEPFVECVYNDWAHLGVTLIQGGDNNMGQWVDMVMQPNLSDKDFQAITPS